MPSFLCCVKPQGTAIFDVPLEFAATSRCVVNAAPYKAGEYNCFASREAQIHHMAAGSSVMMMSLRKETAFSRPSCGLIKPSSCSMLTAPS